jgi:hypothetical protein
VQGLQQHSTTIELGPAVDLIQLDHVGGTGEVWRGCEQENLAYDVAACVIWLERRARRYRRMPQDEGTCSCLCAQLGYLVFIIQGLTTGHVLLGDMHCWNMYRCVSQQA